MSDDDKAAIGPEGVVGKLDAGEKHLLRLVAKGQHEGWAAVSRPVAPFIQRMPRELVEFEPLDDGRGRARLTPQGAALLYAMEWL